MSVMELWQIVVVVAALFAGALGIVAYGYRKRVVALVIVGVVLSLVWLGVLVLVVAFRVCANGC